MDSSEFFYTEVRISSSTVSCLLSLKKRPFLLDKDALTKLIRWANRIFAGFFTKVNLHFQKAFHHYDVQMHFKYNYNTWAITL